MRNVGLVSSQHWEKTSKIPEAECKVFCHPERNESRRTRESSSLPNAAVLFTFSVILHVLYLLSPSLSLTFVLLSKPKTPAEKPTPSFPAQLAAAGGGGSREPGPCTLTQSSFLATCCRLGLLGMHASEEARNICRGAH